MNCKNCDRPLLPQDDVESPRYKLMGCLNCQISIIANHKYGDDIVPVKHGIPIPALTLAITEADALRVLALIDGAWGGSEIDCTDEDLLLAKKLIEHFHINSYGWLLTEYADLCERKRLGVLALPVIDCAHTRTKPLRHWLRRRHLLCRLREDDVSANTFVIGFIIVGCITIVVLCAYIVCLIWYFLFRCWHLRTKPYDIGFDKGTCCADCGRMLS